MLSRYKNRWHKYYRLYLTDGGATTAQGIELREETVLPLGLKLISPIFKKYKAIVTPRKAAQCIIRDTGVEDGRETRRDKTVYS